MQTRISTLFLVAAMLWAAATAARAQGPSTANFAAPSVSPYLNLGVTATGMSNYSTLVRPMLDDQEALVQQGAEIQRLQRQLRGGDAPRRSGSAVRDAKAGASNSGRFMYFSHYFVPGGGVADDRAGGRMR
jgi:hypothetical protein